MRSLQDYRIVADFAMSWMARSTRFTSEGSFSEMLAQHPRLIVVLNHSTPLSWIPGPLLLTLEACARGAGGRKPFAVMDRFFYANPILARAAQWISQSEVALSYSTLVERMRGPEDFDLVLFPEGSNCFFEPPGQVGDFRSEKFIQLSFDSQVPLLVCAHRGSEHWAKTLNLESGDLLEFVERAVGSSGVPQFVHNFLFPRLRTKRRLNVPWLLGRMPLFELHAALVLPPQSASDDDFALTKARVRSELAYFENR